jgi:hypothetical protein
VSKIVVNSAFFLAAPSNRLSDIRRDGSLRDRKSFSLIAE